jgi:hypothetical protein
MCGRMLVSNNLQSHQHEASQLHQSIKSCGMMNELEHDAAQNECVKIEQQIHQLV